MKTVPLHGKKAAGRVALVDDSDCTLVAPYTWRVYERVSPGKLAVGPYAITSVVRNGRNCTLPMHALIMGRKKIDHIDHNGLNNQRTNLRFADHSQNGQNQRPRIGFSSQYKGVFLRKDSGLWHAVIRLKGINHHLGDFASEMEAAYVYDAAAREMFGEFACPNFQDVPTQAIRDQWDAEREARHAVVLAGGLRRMGAAHAARWAQIEPEARICTECGGEYRSRSLRESYYCGSRCKSRAWRRKHPHSP